MADSNNSIAFMTESKAESTADTPENSNTAKPPVKVRIKRILGFTAGRRPAYRVTKSGIKQEWHDFTQPETLPFDTSTYSDTQLFIGNYANPWYVDIESIEDKYDRFSQGEPIKNLIENNHVIPSQRYKTYMNQAVLKHTFQPGKMQSDRIQYLLYAILAIGVFNLLIMVT